MKNNIILTSIISICVACPVMAATSHVSQTFPNDGKMLEDYTYQNQATYANLHSYTGPVDATGIYGDCPVSHPNTDDGATSMDECYAACTTADLPANSHAASASGKNYYGANMTDTCAIATCDTGYTLNYTVLPGGPDLMTAIGLTDWGNGSGAIRNDGIWDGNAEAPQDHFGLTSADKNMFGVRFYNDDRLIGIGRCSTQGGTAAYGAASAASVTTASDVTANFDTGTKCWCKLTQYIPDGGTSQNLTGQWVFMVDLTSFGMGAADCADQCASGCGSSLESPAEEDDTAVRPAMFGSLGASVASCDANEISITWADASAEDIAANDAGSVTYGGDIRTPKKAVHKPGKIFTGWTFNIPSGN